MINIYKKLFAKKDKEIAEEKQKLIINPTFEQAKKIIDKKLEHIPNYISNHQSKTLNDIVYNNKPKETVLSVPEKKKRLKIITNFLNEYHQCHFEGRIKTRQTVELEEEYFRLTNTKYVHQK